MTSIAIPMHSYKYPGLFSLVDPTDYDAVSSYRWYPSRHKHTFYAATRVTIGKQRVHILMHRLILGAYPGQDVDHKNHNGLDNQRDNIHLCSRAENLCNQGPRPGVHSGFKGVWMQARRKTWVASIWHGGRYIHLGSFADKLSAAIAYNQAASRLRGKSAQLNSI